MRQYDQGQAVRVTQTFYDVNGALYDPDTITITIRRESIGDEEQHIWDANDSSASSTTVDEEIYRTYIGVYYLDVDTSLSGGVYSWRIQSTDAVNPDTAKTGQFYVKPNYLTGVDDSSAS